MTEDDWKKVSDHAKALDAIETLLDKADVPVDVSLFTSEEVGQPYNLASRVLWLIGDRNKTAAERNQLQHVLDELFKILVVPDNFPIVTRAAELVRECEQLRKMHDGVSADLDRERREHQEAMAEAAARELKLTEERDELSARYNRVMDEIQVKAETRVFSVVLKSAGPYKISVIKAIREVTGLGLKDAKDLMDGAPSEVLNGWNEDEARSAIDRLSAVGADVELKSEVPDPDRVAMRQRELRDIEKQRNAFMLQRDAAIQDAKFFKSEAEKAVADLAEVSAVLDKAGVPRSVDSMGNMITPAGRVAVLLALHERLAPPKRRSKTKPTKKLKAAAKRGRRKP